MSGFRFVTRDDGMLTWISIARLGLVQAALGSMIVLTTATYNRVMQVELGTEALIPGFLVGLYYGFQALRPKMGHAAQMSRWHTPWILGGMLVLAVGNVMAAWSVVWMADDFTAGLLFGVLAYVAIGVGVSAAGTPLLVLVARHTSPQRKAAAATIVWLMMIAGIVFTAITAGIHLDPFSFERMIAVATAVSALAFTVAALAILGIETRRPATTPRDGPSEADNPPFRRALREVWAEPESRRFTLFVFVSMLAYNTQEMVMEPFAGRIFGMTPGESTALSGNHHAGLFVGIVLFAMIGSWFHDRWFGALRLWLIGGCLLSAAAFAMMAIGSQVGLGFPLRATVLLLGFGNGAFTGAALSSMMGLVSAGTKRREGVRMGVWGFAQGSGFGLGLLFGAAAYDTGVAILGEPGLAYALVFGAEGLMFVTAAAIASRLRHLPAIRAGIPLTAARPT